MLGFPNLRAQIGYVHDPLGRRIAKKVNGTVIEKYLWQGMTRLLAVYDGSDNLLMRFEYADARMPIAMSKDGVVYYLAYDQVGSLKTVADASGAVVKRVGYDSFGNIIEDTNPAFAVPFGFAGGLHDRDSGLVRFGYRDYDPEVGRWTVKDPIRFDGGDTDLYGYCLSDPINAADPDGLEIRLYVSAAFGLDGAAHLYFHNSETEDSKGTSGSSGSDFGNDGSNPHPKYYIVIDTNGLSDEEFMRRIHEYPGWNAGLYLPWLNDCHSQAEKACIRAGGEFEACPTGRIDYDDKLMNYIFREFNRYINRLIASAME